MPSKQFNISAPRTPPKSLSDVRDGVLCRVVDKVSIYHNAIVVKCYSGVVGIWFPKSSLSTPFRTVWRSSPNFMVAELSSKENIVITSEVPANDSYVIPMKDLDIGQLGVIHESHNQSYYHGTVVVGVYGNSTLSIFGVNPFIAQWSHPDRNIPVRTFTKEESVSLRQS